jgi:RND family efflux transporter MFP subunit
MCRAYHTPQQRPFCTKRSFLSLFDTEAESHPIVSVVEVISMGFVGYNPWQSARRWSTAGARTLGIMRGHLRRQASIGAVAALLATTLAGCASPYAGGGTEEPALSADRPPTVVQVVHPSPANAENAYLSSLYAERDVVVTPRRSGVIEKVLVERGEHVRADQPLAVLETDLAAHELEIAEHELRLAEAEYERMRSLHDQNVVSTHEFLRASIARDRSEGAVGLARGWLERCTVRAPFEGTVVERWAVLGLRVQEDQGTPLFRIVANEPHRARVDVPEEHLPEITLGAEARVWPRDRSRPHTARVVFVSPAIDPASGTAAVIVEMASREEALRLGATVEVQFENLSGATPGPLSIPRKTLQGASVWQGLTTSVLVISEGHAQAREVRVVATDGSSVLVTGDLAPEDRVIIRTPGLEIGDPVVASEEAT